MERKEKVRVIRAAFAEKKQKATDLQIVLEEVAKLPYGQLKKVLTPTVLQVLEKYGIGEDSACA